MKSKSLLAPAVILVGMMLSHPASAGDYVKSYSITHRADVRVHGDDSSVHVITSNDNKVEFHVHYEGFGLQLGNQLHIDSQQNGDHVELTEQVGPGITLLGNRQISTEVHMPRDADLVIETSDGAVQVSSVNGKVMISTKDGGIKVSQLSGSVELRSADGGITVDTLKGESTLHTKDGTVSVRNVDGKLTASSTDGTIRAEGRFDFLDLKSADGSINARIEQGSRMSSPWSIRTKDGSVNVGMPDDFRANVDVATRDGGVGVDAPLAVQGTVGKTRIQGTLNGGGPLLTVRTEDGSVRLRGL